MGDEVVDLSFFDEDSGGGWASYASSSAFEERQESNFVGLMNQGATVCIFFFH
jgi:hypothetical protein